MTLQDVSLVFSKKRLTHETLIRLAESGHFYCPRCQQVKPLTEFRTSASKKTGVRTPCKACEQVTNQERNATEKRKAFFEQRNERLRKTDHRRPARNQSPDVVRGIYVLRMGDAYKIGQSVNVHKRVCDLRASLPFPSELICVVPVVGPLVPVEVRLHQRFARCRTNGEWFALTPVDIAEIKKGTVS